MIKLLQSLALVMLAGIVFQTNALAADKPFAEQKVVLQISDADPTKQTLVLNVANNLIKHYGPDKVDVEIVAFGPGLRLMFDDNHNKGRISGLTDNGVRFGTPSRSSQPCISARSRYSTATPPLCPQAWSALSTWSTRATSWSSPEFSFHNNNE